MRSGRRGLFLRSPGRLIKIAQPLRPHDRRGREKPPAPPPRVRQKRDVLPLVYRTATVAPAPGRHRRGIRVFTCTTGEKSSAPAARTPACSSPQNNVNVTHAITLRAAMTANQSASSSGEPEETPTLSRETRYRPNEKNVTKRLPRRFARCFSGPVRLPPGRFSGEGGGQSTETPFRSKRFRHRPFKTRRPKIDPDTRVPPRPRFRTNDSHGRETRAITLPLFVFVCA